MPPPNSFAFPESQVSLAPTATAGNSGSWGSEESKQGHCSVIKERDQFWMVPQFTSYVTLSLQSLCFFSCEMGLMSDLRHQLSCPIASFRKPSLAPCTLARFGPLVSSFIAYIPIHQALMPLRLTPGISFPIGPVHRIPFSRTSRMGGT